jgi:RHS repeat-associated protein
MTYIKPATRAHQLSAIFRLCMLTLLFLVCASSRVGAQSTGAKPANAAAGAPAGSYSLSGFENVNLFSGNLNFHLPLVGVGGRGGVKIPVMLAIDSVRWRLKRGKSTTNTGDDPGRLNIGGGQSITLTEYPLVLFNGVVDPGEPHYTVLTSYSVQVAEDGLNPIQYMGDPAPVYYWVDPYGFQGADPGYGPGVLQARTVSIGGRDFAGQRPNLPGRTLTTVVFTTPDGTEYTLYDQGTMGVPFSYAQVPAGQPLPPKSRGTTFVSTDGSDATFVSDAPVMEYFSYATQTQVDYPSALSGYLMLADGTRYRIAGGRVMWVRDRNGNVITYDYTGGLVTKITDSMGRTVEFRYHVQVPAGTPCSYNTDTTNDGTRCWYDEITTKGGGGVPHTLRVWHAKLDRALRHDYTSVGTYPTLFPAYEQEPGLDEEYNPADVRTAVELPDGRSYVLRYNRHNELAQVVLPTGGATEYDYTTLMSPVSLQRAVGERRVYLNASDTVPQSVQQYGRELDPLAGTETAVTVTANDGAGGPPLSIEKHYFYGNVLSGHLGFYSSWREGREFKSEVMAADGVTPLRRVENEFEARAYPSWYASGQAQTSGPALDPRLHQTQTTLTDTTPNLSTKQVYYYDTDSTLTYNLQTKVEEYGFGAELLRSTETAYEKSAAYAAEPVHMRGLPLRKSVYDAAGKERARTTFEYDNYTPDAGGNNRHAELTPYGDIFGLCTTFDAAGNCSNPDPVSYKTRGNVTGMTSYLLDKDGNVTGSITSNSRYDVAGNVVKAIDARVKPDGGGYETTFDFSDNFGSPDAEARDNTAPAELGSLKSHGLPKSVTNALGHTAYTQYDYHTGQVVNSEDANGTVTKLVYGQNDPLDRLTQVEVAANYPSRPELHGQKTYSYDDASRTVTTTSDLRAYGDNLLKSQALYDGLGRTTEARQYETPTQYVATVTQYDALGRAVKVSNPYRPASESPVWTVTKYDALGRVSTVTTPDNATAYMLYDGVRTLSVDQAGKQRISVTDGLGYLADVWEVTVSDAATELVSFTTPSNFPYPAPAAGYRTGYAYDVLGNLRRVEQGTQRRYFAYDSLGRMIRAYNPEQEANAALALPADMLNWSADDHNGWTLAYEYDENGNLKKRTDARGVETTYAYDALGRVTDRGYTGVPLAQGGTISTPSVKYYYDSQALPAGGPAFNRGKSTGQLVAVTYGGDTSTTGNYTGAYDELGHAHYSAQVTAPNAAGQSTAQTYAFGYEYHLDGSLKSETYPSGRIVESEYDGAGRLAGVKNQGGDYYAGGSPVANNPNAIAYSAHGAVTALRLGNGLWEHTLYNSRLQHTEIGLGTSRTDSSKLKLEYGYGLLAGGAPDATRNNGNVRSQSISVPAEGAAAAQTFTQTYTYDALNRLETAEESGGSGQTWTEGYAYDRYGNRGLAESQTKRQNQQRQLVAVVGDANRAELNPTISSATNRVSQAGYAYDAAGNLLCDTSHACGPQTSPTPYFGYDGENKMVSAGGAAQSGGAEYVYDGDGRRVKTVVGVVTTVFVYDAAGQLAAEYSNQVEYGGTSYVTQDALGSTRAVTGPGQEVRGRYDYRPFGEDVTIGRSGYGGANVRQKFAGYEFDGESGLAFAQARHYGNTAGRFTSPDPSLSSARPANPQSWNRYTYTINNPINLTDPTGLDWGYCDFKNGTGNYHYFDGSVGEYEGHMYTPVKFGYDGYLDVTSSSGERFRISNNASEPLIPMSEVRARERAREWDQNLVLRLYKVLTRPETPILLIQPATIPLLPEGGPMAAAEVGAEAEAPAAAAASEAATAARSGSTALATMQDAYYASGQVRQIAGYDIGGSFGRVGSTYNVSIWGMFRNPASRGSMFTFTRTLEAEARASGATSLNIVGTHIMNPTFINAANAERASRLGFTFRQVNQETVIFSKPLVGP